MCGASITELWPQELKRACLMPLKSTITTICFFATISVHFPKDTGNKFLVYEYITSLESQSWVYHATTILGTCTERQYRKYLEHFGHILDIFCSAGMNQVSLASGNGASYYMYSYIFFEQTFQTRVFLVSSIIMLLAI